MARWARARSTASVASDSAPTTTRAWTAPTCTPWGVSYAVIENTTITTPIAGHARRYRTNATISAVTTSSPPTQGGEVREDVRQGAWQTVTKDSERTAGRGSGS